jgi:hypothetical protein
VLHHDPAAFRTTQPVRENLALRLEQPLQRPECEPTRHAPPSPQRSLVPSPQEQPYLIPSVIIDFAGAIDRLVDCGVIAVPWHRMMKRRKIAAGRAKPTDAGRGSERTAKSACRQSARVTKLAARYLHILKNV